MRRASRSSCRNRSSAEGLSAAWEPLKEYWADPTLSAREKLRNWLDEAGTRQQYVAGTPADQLERFAPETWTLDWTLLGAAAEQDAQRVRRDHTRAAQREALLQTYADVVAACAR